MNLAAPTFFVFLLGSVLLLLVATGIVTLPADANGRDLGRVTALLVAIDYGVISLTGWAIYNAKPWARPLLLWLPVPLGLIGLAGAQSSELSIGGLLLQNVPNWLLWIAVMYWYLYMKDNVVEYFRGRIEQ